MYNVGQNNDQENQQEFRDAIKRIYGGEVPMIELFARKHMDGWDSWGDEL